MFIVTARFSKKRALVLLLLFVAAAAALFLLLHTDRSDCQPILKNNADRIAYLQSLGWEVTSEPLETLQLRLPEILPDNYTTYNQLQLQQGFDLTACCGKTLTRYTYAVSNYPGRPEGVQLNLYVCQELPVAGDIIAPGSDGFQSSLIRPTEK